MADENSILSWHESINFDTLNIERTEIWQKRIT